MIHGCRATCTSHDRCASKLLQMNGLGFVDVAAAGLWSWHRLTSLAWTAELGHL